MRRLTAFAALILPFSYPVAAFASDLSFTGTAKPVDGGATIYQEFHSISGSCATGVFAPEEHVVEYRRSGPEHFAIKNLSYQQSVLRPSFEFSQPDFSEMIRISNQDDQTLEILWQAPSGSTEQTRLEVEPSLVADAGFDNFVRQNWQQLTEKGESVRFNMVAPTRGDYYGFVLEPTSDSRIDAEHLLRIRPSSTLMRFLVDPILLGYSDAGLLTDYLGLTNIRKNEDNNHTAHIRYTIQTMPECEMTR
jgi:hypothetical protein